MPIYVGTTLVLGGCGCDDGGGGGGEVDPGMPTAGLVAQWLASNLTTQAPGSPVGSWPPSTGGGQLVAVGTARPTLLDTGSPLGSYAVEFDGDANRMTWAGPSGIPTGVEPGAIVIIGWRQRPPVGDFGNFVQYGTTAADRARGLANTDSGFWSTNEWVSTLTSGPLAWDGTPHVIANVYTAAEQTQLWIDGSPRAFRTATLNTATGPGTNFEVGSRLGGGRFGGFRVMEIEVYDHAPTDAEWRQIMVHARIAHGVYP